MLKFECNSRQFNALHGLAYWVADAAYIRERFGDDEPELKKADDTIRLCCFPELDRLDVPFWVQNSAVAIGNDWRKFKERYFAELLKEKNIYSRG